MEQVFIVAIDGYENIDADKIKEIILDSIRADIIVKEVK